MASNNQLLGSGKPPVVVDQQVIGEQLFAPAWRFHPDCPEGILVKTDKQLDELDLEGWKDHPGKVRLLPGHEAIWEAEKLKNAEDSELERMSNKPSAEYEQALAESVSDKGSQNDLSGNKTEYEKALEGE